MGKSFLTTWKLYGISQFLYFKSKNMLPSDRILPCPIPLRVVILLVFISFIEKCVIFISEMSAPVSISSVIGVLVLSIKNCTQ